MRVFYFALMGAGLLAVGFVLAMRATEGEGASGPAPGSGEVSMLAEMAGDVPASMPAAVPVGETGDVILALREDERDDDDDDWRDDRRRRGSWVCFARIRYCRDRDHDRDGDHDDDGDRDGDHDDDGDRDWDDDDDSRDRDGRYCVTRVYSAVAARKRRAIRRAIRKCVRHHPRHGDRCRVIDCHRVRGRDHDRDGDWD